MISWKFPSSHFHQPSLENDGGSFHRHFELQSYTCEFAVFGIETFIFGNLTKPLSILHFLTLSQNDVGNFRGHFECVCTFFGISILDHCLMALREKKKTNCKTFCLKRLETGTTCIKKGIYYRTSPVHGNILNFHST